MLINWFTVIAQILNFLILVWLLKRFLYKPILNAIDEREKKITAQIEDAEKKDVDAKQEKEEFKKKNEVFDKEKNDLMKKAIEETKTEKSRLLEEARKDTLALRIKLENILKEDQKHIGEEIARKTKTEIFAIARKTLKALADSNLEEQMINMFIKKMQNLNPTEKKQLITSFKSSDKPIIVRSTFELTSAQQSEIKKSFKEELENSSQFQFEIIPELISGIEVNVNGYKVEWSISEYLTSLEKTIEEVINSETKTPILDSEENTLKEKNTIKSEDKETEIKHKETTEAEEKKEMKPEDKTSVTSENKEANRNAGT